MSVITELEALSFNLKIIYRQGERKNVTNLRLGLKVRNARIEYSLNINFKDF